MLVSTGSNTKRSKTFQLGESLLILIQIVFQPTWFGDTPVAGEALVSVLVRANMKYQTFYGPKHM
jgi:hypothetical protein